MNEPSLPFERPLVTVDVVLLTLMKGGLHCLLVQRQGEPFAGQWALPGGFVHVDVDRSALDCAERVLAVKAGAACPYLEQLQHFADNHRDPRGWSVSLAYMALVPESSLPAEAEATRRWVPVAQLPPLPFDHADIVASALTRLQSKTLYSSLPVYLIPEVFSIADLRAVYEALLQNKLEPRGFRRHIESLGILEEVPGLRKTAGGRSAQVYRVRPEHRGGLTLAPKNLGAQSVA